MPAGVPWPRYIRMLGASVLAMFAGAQFVHQYCLPDLSIPEITPKPGELRTELHDADSRGDHHEEREDLFLRGPGYVAVHLVGTRWQLALDQAGHVVTVVDEMQDIEEASIEARLEDQTHLVGIQVLPIVGGSVRHVLLLPVLDVTDDHERWAGDEDELQGPQADVGDGEDMVIADVGAAWLLSVAVEVFGFVAPHPLNCYHKHQDPEDEHHRKPDAAKRRGSDEVDAVDPEFKEKD
ncbi:hypothetical protein CCH79_00008403 [Gambusia affinis]|uniref:Uncharacterized protein n=1 Tax=Gambusia affinis TaxID=33528 RepID=A0A315UXF8_GAMAF|nr:hypothetical protein CCH79_00008403 [Gambusia affinis]